VTSAQRWGILATGSIAATVADDLGKVPGAVRHAVASRDAGRAADFAAEHGFERSYGSYEQLLADPDVDVVYVATPHAQHHSVVAEALTAGVPCLVEKAFTCSASAADDLIEKARSANVFMMEAMWNRFQPGMAGARRLVADGAIGEVRAVHADLGFVADVPASHRLLNPATGGGALLDLGVYLASFSQWFLGAPSEVQATGRIGPTGVDIEAGLLLSYPGDAHAVLSCSLASASPGQAAVVGTTGRVIVPPRFHHPPRVIVERTGHDPLVIENPLTGRGYTHELAHVGECLGAGLTESAVMPLDDTAAVMRVLTQALDLLGVPHVDADFGVGQR
jgi:predicted dehydrogenase